MSTVAEYKALKERGEQLFDGLRDLPQFGKRLWEPYFRRTFDVYNQLWKFQQEHRGTLEAEYGLQRHEVRLRAPGHEGHIVPLDEQVDRYSINPNPRVDLTLTTRRST